MGNILKDFVIDPKQIANFSDRLDYFHDYFDSRKTPPVLVFTDMHGDNFFVDENGIPSALPDSEAIDFLSGCRLLELAQSYWGHADGVRDSWGKEMKELLFRYMDTGRIYYMKIGDIWRQRDQQPLSPRN